MSIFQTKNKTVITCAKHLSAYLHDEVVTLGFTPYEVWATGVSLEATLIDCIRLNLNLRTANQVLFSLGDIKAADADGLYKGINRLPWENWVASDGYISITSTVNNPTMDTPLFANLKCKDAIVDRIRDKTGERPDSGPERDKMVIHLHWVDNLATVYLDTSGETLTKHGYRKMPGSAPMQESLAAACISATEWDGKSTFINPMCGSGTLAIEAALKAMNKAPGLLRSNFAFMHIEGYQNEWYEHEAEKALGAIQTKNLPKIIATDKNANAIYAAQENAKKAGVEKYIEFAVCDFRETEIPENNKGVIIINPEYGERLGEYEELEPIYKAIGDFYKQKCGGYKGYVFTGSPSLSKKIGLSAKRKIPFFNGKIDCRLMEYELYEGTRRG